MSLKVKICGIEFANPIIAASGTFGFGREYAQFYDLSILGGISTKGLTYEPRQGNASPRIAETQCGILNSVGLQNPGVRKFISQELPFLKKSGTKIIANIAGNTELDYCKIAYELSDSDVDILELNISCPNVKQGGIAFGVEPKSVEHITRQVKNHTKKPLMVKLSPNVANIADNALAAEAGGADCISLINTLGGLAVDYKTRKPILASVYGGLSGACIKPVALKMVRQVFERVKVPVVGMGGIMTAKDVLEFMICGATAVMIGTANIIDPMACSVILKDLTKLVNECKIDNIAEIVGTLKV